MVNFSWRDASEMIAWKGFTVQQHFRFGSPRIATHFDVHRRLAKLARHSGPLPMAGQLRLNEEPLLVAFDAEQPLDQAAVKPGRRACIKQLA